MADIIFRNMRPEVEEAARKAFDVGMEAVAAQAEGNAKREITKLVYDTPPSPNYVRTGRLRNNIAHQYVPEEKAAYIGTNVEYGPYVELGTIKMAARPFLRNAAQNYSEEYRRILEDALKMLSD